MFRKYCKEDQNNPIDQLIKNKYSPIWAAFSYFSYPSNVQEVLAQKNLKEIHSNFPKLDKFNKIAQSQFTNARMYFPRSVQELPEVLNFFIKLKQNKSEQAFEDLDSYCDLLEEKYGDKSITWLYLKYYILKYCTHLSREYVITEAQRMVEILERYHDTTNFLMVSFCDLLAENYIVINQVQESSKYIKMSSKITHKLVRSPSLELIKLHYIKSISYSVQGYTVESEVFASKMVDELKDTKDVLDESTRRFITKYLSFIVSKQVKQGKLSKAEESIQIIQKVFADNKVENLGANLSLSLSLAGILESQQKYEEAIQELENAAEIFTEQRGEKVEKELAKVYLSLGHLYLKLQQRDEQNALECFEKSSSIAQETLGEDHIITLKAQTHIGICLVLLLQIDEGVQLIQGVYKRAVEKFKANNPIIQEIEDTYRNIMESTKKVIQ